MNRTQIARDHHSADLSGNFTQIACDHHSADLSGNFTQIARDHHSVDLSGDLPLTIVRLANDGSRKLGLGLDPDPNLQLSETPEARILNTEETLLEELQAMLEEHLTIAA